MARIRQRGDAFKPDRALPVATLVLSPTIAVIATGVLSVAEGPWFQLGYVAAVIVLVTSLVLLRQRPVAILAALLLWLSIQRLAVAALSPVLSPDQVTALLGYKELFFPVLLLVLLPRSAEAWKSASAGVRSVDVLAVAFAALVMGALLLSPAPIDDRIVYARRLAVLPLVYVTARLLPWDRASARSALWLIVAAAMLIAVFGLVERFVAEDLIWRRLIPAGYFYHLTGLAGLNTPGTDFPLEGLPRVFYDFTLGGPQRRLVSTYLEATTLASFLAFVVVVAIPLSRRAVRGLVILLLVGVVTVLTLSKAGVLIAGLGLSYLAVTRIDHRLRGPAWLGSLAITVLAGMLIVAVSLELTGVTTGALAHLRGLGEGLHSAFESPLGIGLGMAGGFAASMAGSESTFGVLLVQLGIPGLALWLAWIVGLAYVVAKSTENRRDWWSLGSAIGVALTGFMISAALTESAGGLLGNWVFAFAAGIICALVWAPGAISQVPPGPATQRAAAS